MLFFEIILVAIFILLQTSSAHLNLDLNDKCTIADSNETGVCRYVEDCLVVQKLFKEQHIIPTLCGFDRDKQIVCCPEEIETRFSDNGTDVSTSSNSISSQKCVEYQKLCSGSTPLNWGGDQSTPTEFPFMAAIGLLDRKRGREDRIVWFTGGILISKNFVMLTNKRLKNNSPTFNRTAKYIRLGITDLSADLNNTNAQQFDIAEIIIHPLREQNTRYNDIALVRIDGEVEFTEYVRPACLAQPETIIGENFLVTGWGQINSQGTIKTDLQKVRFNLVSHADCDGSYKFHNPSNLEHVIFNETQICARSETRGRDACQGFGGAPLINTIVKPSCLYEVIGLTSLGLGCGARNPGVFTRVSAYLDWIEKIVWREGRDNNVVPTTTDASIDVIASTTTAPTELPSTDQTESSTVESITSTTEASNEDPTTIQTTPGNEIDEKHQTSTTAEDSARISISEQKCAEYQTICSESTPLRWEGDQIESKEFPFMAAIGLLEQRRGEEDKIVWFSGGTLISKNFVLSTTKRLGNNSPVFNRTAKYIRLGITDLAADLNDAIAKQFDIAQIFVHPMRQNTRYNDIALFKIDGEVEFTEYIRPACLAQPKTVIGENLLVTGWGQINSRGTVKMDLQKIRFNFVSHADCYASYKFNNPSNLERGIDNETQLCARSETRARDACQGFGGAPLLNTIDKPSCLYEVIGLTSLGIGCGTRNPGAFTRVSAYLDWIENIVWPNSISS